MSREFRSRRAWRPDQEQRLRAYAAAQVAAPEIAARLRRPVESVRTKARQLGIAITRERQARLHGAKHVNLTIHPQTFDAIQGHAQERGVRLTALMSAMLTTLAAEPVLLANLLDEEPIREAAE